MKDGLLKIFAVLLFTAGISYYYDSLSNISTIADDSHKTLPRLRQREKKRIPDVVIIGVKKSGTMTLGNNYT